MLSIAIPGFKNLSLAHLVLDFNGTLAVDGNLITGVSERRKEAAFSAREEIVRFEAARDGLNRLLAAL